jgi:alpha/beta superfamily hydrolase
MKKLTSVRITIVILLAALWALLPAGPQPGAENMPLKIMVNENVILQSANGSILQCYFFMPIEKPRPLPVVIIVPPGPQEAQTIFPFARTIAESGIAVFCFDPQGRGKSKGSEDYSGPTNQDDLAVIVKYLRSLRGEVDYRNIGILSFYDGTTTATGMLFKYPKLDVKYLIDIEGPATRDDAIKMRAPVPPGAGTEDFFWKEREGLTFIKRIFCRYLRLQCKVDHAMNEDKGYAIKMYNAALKGKSPWARCNYNGTYQEMDPAFPGKYQWLRTVDKDVICRFVNEMAQMEPLPESFKN